ncbi:hypothetical protein MUDAN_BIHEEGNE_03176 [Lactiplantibacillus mudanjiangensis]|uniref:hypothetical protein n=1 Tax=Lactiplantibacillus mudanjiangensis TaxID=1296538 RepID=UPI001014B3EF|nr:hypothetical protein MUDAN_BIHEEGNE_03176 [Lactiplantibacillus mudanjiangensis]
MTPDFWASLPGLVTAIGGAAVGLLTFFLGQKKSRHEELEDLYDQMKSERDEYHDKWKESESENTELRKKLNDDENSK